MESEDRIVKLLEEIRDNQREQIEEYRQMAGNALQLQNDAVDRQKAIGRLYKGALFVGGAIVVVIIAVILYLLYVLLGYL